MTKNELVSKAKLMMEAPSCCKSLKVKAQEWIDSIGTANEKSTAENLIKELEADVQKIDAVIAFGNSAKAVEILGKEMAERIAKHASEIKAQGAKYCDCGACANGLEILNNKEVLLK